MIVGLLHVSCGALLAAVPNFVEFPTTYWYPLAGRVLMSTLRTTPGEGFPWSRGGVQGPGDPAPFLGPRGRV